MSTPHVSVPPLDPARTAGAADPGPRTPGDRTPGDRTLFRPGTGSLRAGSSRVQKPKSLRLG